MREHKIYLVGQISSDPKTYQWRINIRFLLKTYPPRIQERITIIDPCENSMNLNLLKNAEKNEQEFNCKAQNCKSLSILTPLDAGYVEQSTICIANLNHYTPERPIIGSYFELAWYYYNFPHKPVIGIITGSPDDYYHTKHPFVKSSVHVWVNDEKEALDLIVNQCFC